ncbi:uncharacterized protein BXZ73DRAFT_107120 [Epithele typhae]|uniref:uncharacterized protein n=1 Tax=Epithele typhae TaxID=378194 RepID=UPI00200828A4|nr:uncharacterized protein BXZ73DRAFT_107120 [Epithele typhae]KAH9912976.1 hypothetical protein BXZ73DRAFT_107120 [Epithele typhae]
MGHRSLTQPPESLDIAEGAVDGELNETLRELVGKKTPIHALPLEVLHQVFSYVYAASHPFPSHFSAGIPPDGFVPRAKIAHKAWTALLAVCSLWRRFICSSGEYWRCIHIYSSRPNWLKLCLSRAEPTGPCLDVYFHGISADPNAPSTLLRVLREHAQCLRILSHDEMGKTWSGALHAFLSSQPPLRVLALSCPRWLTPVGFNVPAFGIPSFEIPSFLPLHILVLRNVDPTVDQSLYARSEHLDLSAVPWTSDWDHLHRMLSKCTKLVTLSLRSCISHFDSFPPPPGLQTVTLPRLLKLRLDQRANMHMRLLSFLHLPSIARVHFTEQLNGDNRNYSSMISTVPTRSLPSIFPFLQATVAIKLSTDDSESVYTLKAYLCAPTDSDDDNACALVLATYVARHSAAGYLRDAARVLPTEHVTIVHLSLGFQETASKDFFPLFTGFVHLTDLRLSGHLHIVIGAPCRGHDSLIIQVVAVVTHRKHHGTPLQTLKMTMAFKDERAFRAAEKKYLHLFQKSVLETPPQDHFLISGLVFAYYGCQTKRFDENALATKFFVILSAELDLLTTSYGVIRTPKRIRLPKSFQLVFITFSDMLGLARLVSGLVVETLVGLATCYSDHPTYVCGFEPFEFADPASGHWELEDRGNIDFGGEEDHLKTVTILAAAYQLVISGRRRSQSQEVPRSAKLFVMDSSVTQERVSSRIPGNERTSVLRTATARIVSCQDLIIMIMDHLYHAGAEDAVSEFHDTWSSANRALAAAARSCKVLSAVALARLWRHIYSINQLFKVFPTFTLDTRYKQVLPANPSDEEWARFELYARLIRRLDDFHLDDMAETSFFYRYSRDNLILPHLVHLGSIDIQSPSPFPLALISPTLEYVGLRCGRAPKSGEVCNLLLNTITSLAIDAPNLSTLDIRDWFEFSDDPVAQLAPIRNLKSLRTLMTMGPVDLALTLTLCVELPSLRHLDLAEALFLAEIDYGQFSERFHNLNVLKIGFRCAKSEVLGRFLHEASPPLRSLSLCIIDPWNATSPSSYSSYRQLPHSTGALASVSSTVESLTVRFGLEDTYYSLDDNEHPSLDFCVIEPALALNRLTTVDIHFTPLILLDDASVGTMTSAWPLLRILRIRQGHGELDYLPITPDPPDTRTRPTFPSLVALRHVAAHCPRLEEFEFASNLELANLPPSSASLPGPVGHRLPYLDLKLLRDCDEFWDTAPCERVFVALYVDRLFPCLRLPSVFEWDGIDEDRPSRRGLASVVDSHLTHTLAVLQAGRKNFVEAAGTMASR